jgi:hypothetical protein
MSTAEGSADRQAQKYREFMSLLPLTIAIAGLPEAEAGKYFNEGQMDNRAVSIKTAYKIARQIIQEMVK